MKTCKKCNKLKPLANFIAAKGMKDGYRSECRECHAADDKKRWFESPKRSDNLALARVRNTAYRKRMRVEQKCFNCATPCGTKSRCDGCAKVACAEQKRRKYEAKLACFAAYGGAHCICCGETNNKFLTIDHIASDGAQHRLEIFGNKRDSTGMYFWLRKNKFPSGFQVLCFNCNCGRSINKGICPHKELAAA